ncbi:MAG: molybdopterin-dependent oxidoreductase [bacterium]|nr:molybdopterin-dependent oxidoreductase [bacterium]MXX64081.1 molybdopterin-dependent oxidoreductase [Acidimicrobiia bacterium]
MAAVAHGVIGLSFLLLVPWKSGVARSGFRRRRKGAIWSVALVVAVVLTIGSGLLQVAGTTRHIGPLATMQVHVGSAVLSVLLVVWHYIRHPVRPRTTDLSRRNLLRVGSLTAGAGVVLAGWESTLGGLGLPGGERRFTGSHERGSGNPAMMPVTQWFTDSVPRLDRLQVEVAGRVLGPDDLSSLPMETVEATLDCTGGWYSTQQWAGVRLDRLLGDLTSESIHVRSVTGYERRFPARDADRLWLAFEVGGQPLSAGHGYPARIVAPDRRGFWWVKWVDSVTVSNTPAWLQPPFPLT